jgi:transcription initiation factor IIE alpha subunit
MDEGERGMITPFSRSAKVAVDNHQFRLARRMKGEGAIAVSLVEVLLARGFNISVFDSEETVVKHSTDKAEILRNLYQTDEDRIFFYKEAEKQHAGWFYLVYGNCGYDVISDYTANETTQKIYDAIMPTITRVERDIA